MHGGADTDALAKALLAEMAEHRELSELPAKLSAALRTALESGAGMK